jgi:(1->4)-alpha-D-glucan 1-alpha-D-glucosylmutase
VIYNALRIRRKFRLLFEEGAYLPLTVKGSLSDYVVAFCRYKNDIKLIVVVPRFLTGLVKSQAVWDKTKIDWEDTSISLPEWEASSWTDAFTNKTIFLNSKKLLVRDILGLFPLALLYSGELHA